MVDDGVVDALGLDGDLHLPLDDGDVGVDDVMARHLAARLEYLA
jgi:hypothetical protein